MRKLILVLIFLFLCVYNTIIADNASYSSTFTGDLEGNSEGYSIVDELDRAVALGFKPEMEKKAVSYEDMYTNLDWAVNIISPERLEEWQNLNYAARNANKIVNRSSAMVALLDLAEFLGGEYYSFNNWNTINWESPAWETGEWNPDSYWGDLLRYPEGFNNEYENDGSNFGGTAYFYSMGRVSLVSGKSLFDSEQGLRCNAPLSGKESVLAALRFYESALDSSERVLTEIDYDIFNKAERRKQEILNSSTNIKPSGNVYYVSTDGNDNNNGLSELTPWKTLEKVSGASLKSGDTVFFKRGDIWREEKLAVQPGVTYSAYGEGKKPAFYGSPENGASAEKWRLLDGTTNIWMYYKEILECGTIVLDDKIGAFKVSPHLINGKYTMEDGSDFDIKKALSEDLMFYSEDNFFLTSEKDVYSDPKTPGKLYFRCDQGNPGVVFSSIEFCPWINSESAFKGVIYSNDDLLDMVTIDNITVKYTGVYGMNFISGGVTVQNCEVGWVGGCVTDYRKSYDIIRFGNCIGNSGKIDGYKVINNYLYQALDSGISNEGNSGWAREHKNIELLGNLIEDCVFSIEMFIENDNPDVETKMENITISDNIIMNTGFGFGSDRQYREWDVHAGIMMHPYYTDLFNMSVENNIFYRSKTYLILNFFKTKSEQAHFSHNTYVQDNLGLLCGWVIDQLHIDYRFDANAAKTIREILRDDSAVAAELSFPDTSNKLQYTIALMPEELQNDGILCNDSLFAMPYNADWTVALVEGEDLDARITDGVFWIDRVPMETGTTIYKVADNDKQYDVILEIVEPNPLPKDAVLLAENGTDIRDQHITIQVGEKFELRCCFVPENWSFLNFNQEIAVWMDEGDGEIEAECDGTKGIISFSSPGDYRIGVMVTSGNAVAYRFFTVTVE